MKYINQPKFLGDYCPFLKGAAIKSLSIGVLTSFAFISYASAASSEDEEEEYAPYNLFSLNNGANVINVHPNAQTTDSLFFYWEKDDCGNYLFREYVAPKDVGSDLDKDRSGYNNPYREDPRNGTSPYFEIKYNSVFGNANSNKVTHLIWDWNRLDDSSGYDTLVAPDHMQRRMLESKVANYPDITNSFNFRVYGVADTDGKQAYCDTAGSLFYNFAATSTQKSLFETSYLKPDANGNISGTFIRNHADKIVYEKKQTSLFDNEKKLYMSGGAIIFLENATLGNISGDFIGNYTRSGSYSNNTDGSGDSQVRGGIIYNGPGAEIGIIDANFIGNYSEQKHTTLVGKEKRGKVPHGGVIYNAIDSVIQGIHGSTFIGNFVYASHVKDDVIGGVIANHGHIPGGLLDVTFIGNYAYAGQTANSGVIRNISGTDHNKQYEATIGVSDEMAAASGGTLKSTVNDVIINGRFIGNYARGVTGDAFGGISRNNGGIFGYISGEYYGNYAMTDGHVGGTRVLSIVDKDKDRSKKKVLYQFTYNPNGEWRYDNGKNDYFHKSNDPNAPAGAVYDLDRAEKAGVYRTGAESGTAHGGVYYNTIKLDGTTGKTQIRGFKNATFGNNFAHSKWGEAFGGAIYNQDATIDDILSSSFSGNYARSLVHAARGGAIYNNRSLMETSIGNITGTNFTSNYVEGKIAEGGAIYVSSGSSMGNLGAKGRLITFSGNYAESKVRPELKDEYDQGIQDNPDSYEDDIYKELGQEKDWGDEHLFDISGTDDDGNTEYYEKARGGALFVADWGEVGAIYANFDDNYAKGAGAVRGGALLVTKGVIGHIHGDFTNNQALSAYDDLSNAEAIFGGAMRLDGSIVKQLTANFSNNHSDGAGGALSLTASGVIIEISGTFKGNTSANNGGAVHNDGNIGFRGYLGKEDTTDGNELAADYSNAQIIIDEKTGMVSNATLDATGWDQEQGRFTEQNLQKRYEYDGTFTGGFVNANFLNNKVDNSISKLGGKGGAIYTDKDLFIVAKDGQTSLFSGNMVDDLRAAIYVDNVSVEAEIKKELQEEGLTPGTDEYNKAYAEKSQAKSLVVYLVAKDGGIIQIDDRVRGQDTTSSGFVLRMRGYTEKANAHRDLTGTIILNNIVEQSYTIMDDVTLKIGYAITDSTIDADGRVHSTKTNEDIVDNTRGKSPYLAAAQDGKARVDHQSDVFRNSFFSTRSGLVSLADGAYTEYLFGALISNGYDYLYSDKGTENETVQGSYQYTDETDKKTKSHYAKFEFDVAIDDPDTYTLDVNGVLRKMMKSDVVTVFAYQGDKPGEYGQDGVSKGRITVGSLTINALQDGWKYSKKNQEEIYVQLINYVLLNNKREAVTDPTTLKAFYESFNTNEDLLRLSDQFNRVDEARAFMKGSELLAEDIIRVTTKTQYDSVKIVGWRDNLAEWAEHQGIWDQTTVDPDTGEIVEVEGDPNAGKKRFMLDETYHVLTRDINLPETPTEDNHASLSDLIWGNDLELVGKAKSNVLNLQGFNLLSEIDAAQQMRLQYFTLTGVKKQNIHNAGKLTLDSMAVDDALVIDNQNSVTLQGHMYVSNTITTKDEPSTAADDEAPATRELIIDDGTEVGPYKNAASQKTVLYLTGTIEHQNISHRGNTVNQAAAIKTGVGLTEDMLADSNFTSITHLVVTRDGERTKQFDNFQDNTLEMTGGKFNLYDLDKELFTVNNISMKDGLIYVSSTKVDLENKQMGGIRGELDGVDSASYEGGTIWLNSQFIERDSEHEVTHVKFVTEGIGDAVQDNIRNTTAKGPLFEYKVTYNDTNSRKDIDGMKGRNGYYTYVRTGNINQSSQGGGVAEEGGMLTMMQIYNYSFEHADLFSHSITRMRRIDNANSGAVIPVKGYKDSACYEESSPSRFAGLKSGMWVRPYASFEKLPLHNGPSVSTNLYGALVGVDSKLIDYNNGLASVFTIFGSYNGATQKYDGNRIQQDGGSLGVTATLYGENFYTALTLTGAATEGRGRTVYGSDNIRMDMVGIASRTGYNIHLNHDKYVLQPTMLVSFTRINVHDYSYANYTMTSDPMEVLQLNPSLRAYTYTVSGWNPYATLGYVHNIGGKTKFYANQYKLPEMSINPYIEYSLGVQKDFHSKYTLYGEVIGRNGGRNGVELTSGLRFTW